MDRSSNYYFGSPSQNKWCLIDQNLDREISMLRMGSRAAIAAVAEETSGRVTVDDVWVYQPMIVVHYQNIRMMVVQQVTVVAEETAQMKH